MKIAMIGRGAIAGYATRKLEKEGHRVSAFLVRPERLEESRQIESEAPFLVSKVSDLPSDIDCIADCAGHQALRVYGPDILRAGFNLITVSLGALAEKGLEAELKKAARDGGGTLTLASGAIGALDVLRAARVGELTSVRYIGRKPPAGWMGSPAEAKLDLAGMRDEPETHFFGDAREAAQAYPKNANVAAAVALAGVGFDKTQVQLIADPTISTNIHQVEATGEFGRFEFQISGNPLPDNPKSSALAAMSVVDAVLNSARRIRF